jgi:hypothetical protein
MTKSWNGAQWGEWTSLGGKSLSPPTAICWGPNRIDVFHRGINNQVYHRYFDNGVWADDWWVVGGYSMEEIVPVSTAPGKLDIFARHYDNGVFACSMTNGHWGKWYRQAEKGTTSSKVAAVKLDGNKINLAMQGTDNRLRRKVWDREVNPDPGPEEWEQVGDVRIAGPPCFHPAGGNNPPIVVILTDLLVKVIR